MKELSRQARTLLSAGMAGDEPTGSDRARIDARLRARLGAAAFAGSTAATYAAGGKGSAALAHVVDAGASKATGMGGVSVSAGMSGGAIVKVVLVALMAGAVGGGAVLLTRARHARSAAAGAPAAAAGERRAATAISVEARPATEAAPTTELGRAAERAPRPLQIGDPGAQTAAPQLPRRSLRAQPQTPTVKDPLANEVMQLRRARTALSAGDAAGALALLRDLDTSSPRGAFTDERALTEVAALCALGRNAEAQIRADRLLERSPSSAYRDALVRSCANVRRR